HPVAAAVMDAKHVILACEEEVVELTVPGLAQRSLAKLDLRADKAAACPTAVAVTGQGFVRVYDAKTGALRDKFQMPRKTAPDPNGGSFPEEVGGLALSADGKLLAWSDQEGHVYLRTLASKSQSVVETSDSRVEALAFSPDSKELYADDDHWKAHV